MDKVKQLLTSDHQEERQQCRECTGIINDMLRLLARKMRTIRKSRDENKQRED